MTNGDSPIGDGEIARQLRNAEQDIVVPPGFRDRLWVELNESKSGHSEGEPSPVSVRPELDTPELVIAEPGRPYEAPVLLGTENQFDEPTSKRGVRVLAAAAVFIVAIVGGALFLQAGDEPADLATLPTPADTTPTPEGALDGPSGDGQGRPDSQSEDATDELEFEMNLGITEIGESSVEVVFSATSDTAFNATVREGNQVVRTEGGSIQGGELSVLSIGRLETGVSYTIDVTLIGPPVAVSQRLAFRTAVDPNDPTAIAEPLSFDTIELTANGDVELTTNLCSAVSFVLLDSGSQAELARSPALEEPLMCSQSHELDVSAAAATISGDNQVTIIVEAEHVVDGVGTGNVTVRSLPAQ